MGRDGRATARARIAIVMVVLVVGTGLGIALTRCSEPPDRIVLVVIDTLRRDRVSPYGGPVPTPHIDAFAEGGTVFRNAVGAFHQTTMSMASLFTGRTPSIESTAPGTVLPWTGRTWCGLTRLARPGDACVPPTVPTLAEGMRAAGYHTAGVVSNLLLFRPAGYDRGFDDWIEIGPGEEQTRTVDAGMLPYLNARQQAGDRVNRAVADWLARRPSDRFFLYVHYMDVHDWTATGSSYDEAVGKVDRHLGELRRMLADAGLLEGSTVVITADHGEGLGEPHPLEPGPAHVGNPSYQSVLAVPLIVWPRVDADPDRLVRSDDTFRLIRRIAGLEEEPPPDLEDDELFLTEHRVQTYVRGSWKSTWLRGEEQPYLFDLAADPREERSVAAAHPDLVASHRRRIDALSRQLGGATTESGPSADDLERLRALGYVRTGDSGDGSPSE